MLRSMVSSLLQRESITTTLAKAKEAQKLADSVIQWGKNGTPSDWARANSYLLVSSYSPWLARGKRALTLSSHLPCTTTQNPQDTLRPLFTIFAQRYASRPGGYTRLHRAGFRQGDHAPLAVLELVDGPNDLKFENAARTVGREMAVRANEGAGPEGWWSFRQRVEAGGAERVLDKLEGATELHERTRKNVVKALAFRLPEAESVAPEASVAEGAEAPEADAVEPTASLHPFTKFLDRSYHHYLHTLASFTLSTAPTPDPLRTVKQLSQRLTPSDSRGSPKPVFTVPRAGRSPKAGERTDGWAATLEAGRAIVKRGGPISLAKGPRAREARRSTYTGTERSEEELAGNSV